MTTTTMLPLFKLCVCVPVCASVFGEHKAHIVIARGNEWRKHNYSLPRFVRPLCWMYHQSFVTYIHAMMCAVERKCITEVAKTQKGLANGNHLFISLHSKEMRNFSNCDRSQIDTILKHKFYIWMCRCRLLALTIDKVCSANKNDIIWNTKGIANPYPPVFKPAATSRTITTTHLLRQTWPNAILQPFPQFLCSHASAP